MHALRPGGVRIPRGFKDSRTVVALEYRRYVLALLDRLGPLPRAADPMVRELRRSRPRRVRIGALPRTWSEPEAGAARERLPVRGAGCSCRESSS